MGLSDVWEWVVDKFESITEFFSGILGGSEVLGSPGFWLIYAALVAALWVVPGMMGVKGFSVPEKIMYSIIFFVLDYLIAGRFMD